MATPDQIPTDLTIDLGDDLAPEEFVAAVRNFFGYVKEIAESQKGDGSDVNWVVKTKEGSSLVGLMPNETASASRLSMIYEKARHGSIALAQGDIKGAGLSERAVGFLKAISELSQKTNSGRGINIWIEKRPIPIGGGIARTIKEDWDSDYHDIGTIEGRLEAIQDASGSLKIRVRDFLYPTPINCVVPEKLIEKVLGSFRKRVEIDGRIHYRRDGSPISIEATDIDQLPEDDQLPSAADVRGIMAPV